MTDATDRVQIAELLQRYVDVTDGGTARDWARLFAEDGEFRVFDRVYKEPERLEKFIGRAPKGRHACSDIKIEIDEPEARGRASSKFRFEADDGRSHSRGTYTDELVHTDRGWRIAVRRVEFSATGPDALSE